MHKINLFILILLILFINISMETRDVYAGPKVEIDVTIKNVDVEEDAVVSSINWLSGVNPGITKWKAAEQYLEVHYACIKEQGNINDLTDDEWYNGWGIQIYTDNTFIGRDGPPYLYTGTYVTDPNPNGEPDIGDLARDSAAGLVYETGKYTLPMCWRVAWPAPFTQDEQSLELSIKEVKDAEGKPHLKRVGDTKNYYCWIFMKDEANDGWSNPQPNPFNPTQLIPDSTLKWEDGDSYATVVGSQGIQQAEMDFGGYGMGPLTGQTDGNYGVYIYLGANFGKVAGGDYKTKIYVEMYHY